MKRKINIPTSVLKKLACVTVATQQLGAPGPTGLENVEVTVRQGRLAVVGTDSYRLALAEWKTSKIRTTKPWAVRINAGDFANHIDQVSGDLTTFEYDSEKEEVLLSAGGNDHRMDAYNGPFPDVQSLIRRSFEEASSGKPSLPSGSIAWNPVFMAAIKDFPYPEDERLGVRWDFFGESGASVAYAEPFDDGFSWHYILMPLRNQWTDENLRTEATEREAIAAIKRAMVRTA